MTNDENKTELDADRLVIWVSSFELPSFVLAILQRTKNYDFSTAIPFPMKRALCDRSQTVPTPSGRPRIEKLRVLGKRITFARLRSQAVGSRNASKQSREKILSELNVNDSNFC